MTDDVISTDLDAVLERVRDDVECLRGARMLVTGGTGFVGTWLLSALHHANTRLELDLHVVVLTRDPGSFSRRTPIIAAWAESLRGDITAIPPIGSVDAAVHAATPASADLNDRDPSLMERVIVDGATALLAAVEPSGRIPVLFTSSGAVYGPQPPSVRALRENSDALHGELDPRNAYASGKRRAEVILGDAAANGRISLRIARLFAFVGPYLPLDAHFAIGNFIRDALQGSEIRVEGDGTAVRSYMYAGDLTAALIGLLARNDVPSPINVGSDTPIDMAALAETVRDVMNPDGAVTIAGRRPDQLPTGAGSRYVPDISLLRSLGLGPEVPLPEAIRRTAAWARVAARP